MSGNQHCLILTGWILSTITFPWLCSNHNPTYSSRSWIHPFPILWLSQLSLKIEKTGSFLEVVGVYVSGIFYSEELLLCTLEEREKEVTSQSHRQKENEVLCQESTNSVYWTIYIPCGHSVMNQCHWIPISNIFFILQ